MDQQQAEQVRNKRGKFILVIAGAIGLLIVLVVVAYRSGPSTSTAATNASVTTSTTASTDSPANDQQSQPQDAASPTEEAAAPSSPANVSPTTDPAAEKASKKFLSLPDPKAPVALDQIKGTWWSESDAEQNKAFAFVEEMDLATEPYRARMSLSDGTSFFIKCLFRSPAGDESVADIEWGKCDPLPTITWTRIAMSNVIHTPDANNWGLDFRADGSSYVSKFEVDSICYPNGNCTTAEEAGERGLEKIREARRRGER